MAGINGTSAFVAAAGTEAAKGTAASASISARDVVQACGIVVTVLVAVGSWVVQSIANRKTRLEQHRADTETKMATRNLERVRDQMKTFVGPLHAQVRTLG